MTANGDHRTEVFQRRLTPNAGQLNPPLHFQNSIDIVSLIQLEGHSTLGTEGINITAGEKSCCCGSSRFSQNHHH